MKRLINWIVLCVIITIFAGLIGVSVRQNFRQNANDPQIQMAEDAAQALSNGQPVSSVTSTTTVDISKSLAPFIIVYDNGGSVIVSEARIGGGVPTLPPGVLGYVRNHGEDRITWQPQPRVRIAAVIIKYSGPQSSGFVLAGRSLREIEERQSKLMSTTLSAWALALLLVTIQYLVSGRNFGKYE